MSQVTAMWSSSTLPPSYSPSVTSTSSESDRETWPCRWSNGSHVVSDDCVRVIDDLGLAYYNDTLSVSTTDDTLVHGPKSNTQIVIELYQTWTPILIFFCALTFLLNVFIVVAARWMRRPLTPTMYFSLSLAAADAIASLTVGLGLVFHSLLPKVYNVDIPDWGPCSILALEAMRLAAVIVTVLHLLALAINHYIGIARPLHYAATITKKTTSICIVILWITPNVALFAYFSSIENQGFQSHRCKTDFLRELRFRGQYASFFFAPLFFMIIIYSHIFVIIRRHQANRQTLTQHEAVSFHSRTHSQRLQPTRMTSMTVETTTTRANRSRYHYSSVSSSACSGYGTRADDKPIVFLARRQQREANSSLSSLSVNNVEHSNNVVNRNVKAIITTLLIVGTFIVGWMPAVIWFIVYCKDCVMTFESLDPTVTLPIGITVNSLIVLKSFLDPIIYTARMKDFKVAFHRMRYQVLSKCFSHCRWSTNGNNRGDGPREEGGGTMVHLNRSLLVANNSTVVTQAL